jgi:mannose-6-phosphate isomerase-like protein (cupin superfamily)
MVYVAPGEAPNAAVVDAGELALRHGSDTLRIPLIASEAYRVVLWQLPAGGAPHPPHRHLKSDETMVVLKGHAEFVVEGRATQAGPGSVCYAPRDVEHTIHVTGPEPLIWLAVVAPNVLDDAEEVG